MNGGARDIGTQVCGIGDAIVVTIRDGRWGRLLDRPETTEEAERHFAVRDHHRTIAEALVKERFAIEP